MGSSNLKIAGSFREINTRRPLKKLDLKMGWKFTDGTPHLHIIFELTMVGVKILSADSI